jgi:dTDP-4-dehydrorhamnose reductase
MQVLVLGVTGMLGSMVYDYLRRNPVLKVIGTARTAESRTRMPQDTIFHLDAERNLVPDLHSIWNRFNPHYVVNCIGITNIHCPDTDAQGVLSAVRVNALFPHALADFLRRVEVNTKTVHITTDCVFSGRTGRYDETALHDAVDFYGKSKSLGEVQADSWLNIRCSIVGPDVHRRTSLLEWFLSHGPGATVSGYSHHMWNGVTTLQFAKLCEEIILQNTFDRLRATTHTLHWVPNESVSKYELLQLFNQIYGRNCRVEKVAVPGPPIDRTLSSTYFRPPLLPMKNAIQELKEYCDRVSFGAEARAVS